MVTQRDTQCDGHYSALIPDTYDEPRGYCDPLDGLQCVLCVVAVDVGCYFTTVKLVLVKLTVN